MTATLPARRSVLPWLAPWLSLSSLLLLAATVASAGPSTTSSAQADFQRIHPCPAHDARPGECPGYVIDYVVPRCLGGPDEAYNMRWQTLAEAKARMASESRRCPPSRQADPVDPRLTT